jgi:hypothetical protein
MWPFRRRRNTDPEPRGEGEVARAPDATPDDIGKPQRVGFDGKPIKPQRGGLTGLEGGGSRSPTQYPGSGGS